jgi:hypothetical protein
LFCRGSTLGNITRTWRRTSNVYRKEIMARFRIIKDKEIITHVT